MITVSRAKLRLLSISIGLLFTAAIYYTMHNNPRWDWSAPGVGRLPQEIVHSFLHEAYDLVKDDPQGGLGGKQGGVDKEQQALRRQRLDLAQQAVDRAHAHARAVKAVDGAEVASEAAAPAVLHQFHRRIAFAADAFGAGGVGSAGVAGAAAGGLADVEHCGAARAQDGEAGLACDGGLEGALERGVGEGEVDAVGTGRGDQALGGEGDVRVVLADEAAGDGEGEFGRAPLEAHVGWKVG